MRELITAYAAFRREHPSAPRLVIAGPCATPAEAASLRRLARTVGLGSGEDPMMDTPVLWLPMLEDEQK